METGPLQNDGRAEQANDAPSPTLGGILRHAVQPYRNHTALLIVTALGIILGIGAVWYVGRTIGRIPPDSDYPASNRIVDEKISKSAAIAVRLPRGVTASQVLGRISFDPLIEGSWLDTGNDRVLAYKPDKPLATGQYHTVTLMLSEGVLTSDFYVDEDPAIEAIFPAVGSEANENSAITILFNRPMVPLSSINKTAEREIPITILPSTKGKFTWISTRNLQFIPEERLRRSSQYTVTVGPGLVSADGLPIPETTHRFTTRPLRYEEFNPQTIGFRDPVRIAFNQPVDLARTVEQISVRNLANGKTVPITVTYGRRNIYDSKKKSSQAYLDRSTIFVYQKNDAHGRENLWDFSTRYDISIKGAVPLEGDLQLKMSTGGTVWIPEVINSVRASSSRSTVLVPEVIFDPEGELIVEFYEPIDLTRSEIVAKGIAEVRHGTSCAKDADGAVRYTRDGTCEMEIDEKIVSIRFTTSVFAKGEVVPIEFRKLYNTDGILLNPGGTLTRSIRMYQKLAILATSPANNGQSASLTDLTLCSNTPLTPVGKEDWKNAIQTSAYTVFAHWSNSFYVAQKNPYNVCAAGQFETQIRYGLLPETTYDITLAITDRFGQHAVVPLSFATQKAREYYTRFHNLQKLYNVTRPGKTTLTFAVENLETVTMNLCKVTAFELLDTLSLRSGAAPPPENCSEAKTDTIVLPKRYWVNNYFQVNIADYFPDSLGHYVLTFSSPGYVERRSNGKEVPRYEQTYVSVTEISAAEKKVNWGEEYYYRSQNTPTSTDPRYRLGGVLTDPGENLYWVNAMGTLKPLVGAVVTAYAREGATSPLRERGSAVTDTSGIARSPVVKDIKGAVVRFGRDSAIISAWTDTLGYGAGAQELGRTYLYTDRPIYRPGQRIFMKGIDRVGYDGTYRTMENSTATITVRNSRGEEIYKLPVPLNEYGTFSADFTLPADAPLGTYHINALDAYAYFDVEEYVSSPFQVALSNAGAQEYIAGDTAAIDLSAKYYFGVPVSGAKVEYSIIAQNYYFDRYTDGYFNFGSGWYYCYYCEYGDRFLIRGTTQLDEEGNGRIEQTLDLKTFFPDDDPQGKIFTIRATVKDASGRSVSGEQSFLVHPAAFYAGVRANPSFLAKNEKFAVLAKTVDINGKPVRVHDLTLTLSKISWNTFKRQEVDGGYYYQTEEVKERVGVRTFGTNTRGDWSDTLTLSDEGQYEIRIESKDVAGNLSVASTRVYVYGEGQVSIKPTNNYSLEIETAKSSVETGDVVKILVKSPFPKARALITTERGKIFDYWIVDIDRNLFDFSIPVTDKYAPTVYVSVLLISEQGEIKFGQLPFTVGGAQHDLNVDVRPDKTHYLPGEKVTLAVRTTDPAGNPVPAELSVAVADLSVLALKGNPKKNPVAFFYGGFPLTVTTSINLKNLLSERDIPAGTKGGGGGEAPDLARRKRGTFADTAFWEAYVRTDRNGAATISFTLPDNLTTWQVESLGITKDTRTGVDYDEFTSRKDLMLVALRPRFIVPGDEFSIGAQIFNQTGVPQRVHTRVSSDSLIFPGDTDETLSVAAGESATVYMRAQAPLSPGTGAHSFILTAENEQFKDEVEHQIAITANDTHETVATAHFTKKDAAREYIFVPNEAVAGKGGVRINVQGTLAVFLEDALRYLATYPYGCSEQVASKLASIAVLKRNFDAAGRNAAFAEYRIAFEGASYTADEAVRKALARVYQAQTYDGGFAYYAGMRPDLGLTLHIIDALTELHNARFEVNEAVLQRAVRYAVSAAQTDLRYIGRNDMLISLAYTLSKTGFLTKGEQEQYRQRIIAIADDARRLNETMSTPTLGYLAILTAEGYPDRVRDAAWKALENRLSIDGRGAYVRSSGQFGTDFYETPEKNTALFLKAIVAQRREHPLTDKVLQWLLRSRTSNGAWGSTNATLAVVDAMSDFLLWQQEARARYTVAGVLDGQEVFSFNIDNDTIFNTSTHVVPIDELKREMMHSFDFLRKDRSGPETNLYYDMAFTYYLPADQIPPRDEGITITRSYSDRNDDAGNSVRRTATVGEVLRGTIKLSVPKQYRLVAVEDFIPAGFEIVNVNLATEDQALGEDRNSTPPYYDEYGTRSPGGTPSILSALTQRRSLTLASIFEPGAFLDWISTGSGSGDIVPDEQLPLYEDYRAGPRRLKLRPDIVEYRDDRLFLFIEALPPGEYEYEYYVRALTPGTYQHLPAIASQMYFPEIFGRTKGALFTVEQD